MYNILKDTLSSVAFKCSQVTRNTTTTNNQQPTTMRTMPSSFFMFFLLAIVVFAKATFGGYAAFSFQPRQTCSRWGSITTTTATRTTTTTTTTPSHVCSCLPQGNTKLVPTQRQQRCSKRTMLLMSTRCDGDGGSYDASMSTLFSIGNVVRVVASDVTKADLGSLYNWTGTVVETWEKCDVDPTCCCAEQVDPNLAVRVQFTILTNKDNEVHKDKNHGSPSLIGLDEQDKPLQQSYKNEEPSPMAVIIPTADTPTTTTTTHSVVFDHYFAEDELLLVSSSTPSSLPS